MVVIIVVSGVVLWCILRIIRDKRNKYEEKEKQAQPIPVSQDAVLLSMQNQYQVIKDTLHLINNSNNFDTVFFRIKFLYDFLDESASSLEPFNDNEDVKGVLDAYQDIYDGLLHDEKSMIQSAIIRNLRAEAKKAKSLKTIKGKRDRLDRLAFNLIERSPENEDLIERWIKDYNDGLEQEAQLESTMQEYTSLPKFKYKSKEKVQSLDSYIALDIETTGLSYLTDKIIQIGAIKFNRKTGEMQEFSTYIDPGIPISDFITELTGITNKDIANAPQFEDIAEDLYQFLPGYLVFAHNASFDMKFLLYNFNALGYLLDNTVCCTVGMSRHFFPALKNFKLNTVAEHLSIQQFAHHTALDDARVCGLIAAECLRRVEEGYEKPTPPAQSNASKERQAYIASKIDDPNLSSFDTYYLGLMLAKEYRLFEGELYIRKAIDMEPQNPLYQYWLADTIVKQNRIDDALNELYGFRDSEYYKQGIVNTSIGQQHMTMIDNAITDIEDKKSRGYVYRPKKRRTK